MLVKTLSESRFLKMRLQNACGTLLKSFQNAMLKRFLEAPSWNVFEAGFLKCFEDVVKRLLLLVSLMRFKIRSKTLCKMRLLKIHF